MSEESVVRIEGESLTVSEKPLRWELSAPTLSFPLKFGMLSYYVRMKAYRAYDLKQYLAGTKAKTAPRGDSLVVREKDPFETASAAFFSKTFAGYFGLRDMTPEQIKAWVDAKQVGVEYATIQSTHGEIRIDPERNISLQEEIAFDLSIGSAVPTFQHLWFDELKGVVRIEMTHRFAKVPEATYRRYSDATNATEIDRNRAEWGQVANYDVVEQCYDQLVTSVEGMCVNGHDCAPENKKEWAQLVPLWHKILVMGDVMRTVAAKNG